MKELVAVTDATLFADKAERELNFNELVLKLTVETVLDDAT